MKWLETGAQWQGQGNGTGLTGQGQGECGGLEKEPFLAIVRGQVLALLWPVQDGIRVRCDFALGGGP